MKPLSLVRPTPEDVVAAVQRRIEEREEVLSQKEESLCNNSLTWTIEQQQEVFRLRAELSALRESGKIDALVAYCYQLLDELLASDMERIRRRISRIDSKRGRLLTEQAKFQDIMNVALEIADSRPRRFYRRGAISDLSRAVHRKIGGPGLSYETIRKHLGKVFSHSKKS